MKEHIIAKYAESTIYDRELLTRLYDYLYSLVGEEKIEIAMQEWVENRDLLQFELGWKGEK